jgi:hypothetical protein
MPSDPIHDKPRYPSSNAYGIPDLAHTPLSAIPQQLAPYRTRFRNKSKAGYGVHFFLFDAIFESVWRSPNKAWRYLNGFEALLTPDFSLNADLPLAVQIFNTYRNRWCGAHWQANGKHVIPTVGWSTPASYEFCFLGIPIHSVVALTTIGTRRRQADFLHGFSAMMERLQPSAILCYGEPYPTMMKWDVRVFPTRYDVMGE